MDGLPCIMFVLYIQKIFLFTRTRLPQEVSKYSWDSGKTSSSLSPWKRNGVNNQYRFKTTTESNLPLSINRIKTVQQMNKKQMTFNYCLSWGKTKVYLEIDCYGRFSNIANQVEIFKCSSCDIRKLACSWDWALYSIRVELQLEITLW